MPFVLRMLMAELLAERGRKCIFCGTMVAVSKKNSTFAVKIKQQFKNTESYEVYEDFVTVGSRCHSRELWHHIDRAHHRAQTEPARY
jgi:hypothetical protein